MFIFKFFTLNNILFYFICIIVFIFLFLMTYKYIYLEQSVYLLSNKINKLEIELNNPSIYNNSNISNSAQESAEIIMNEIFNDDFCCSTNSCPFIPSSPPSSTPSTSNATSTATPTAKTSSNTPIATQEIHEDTIQIVNEIFDLKKDVINDDKESIISANTGGGHATKKALMKLSIDKLKAKCEERKLSTEGTKNQLADKIIIHDNTVEISDVNDE
jgi:hypothetical protein